jgi:hypothetical protein
MIIPETDTHIQQAINRAYDDMATAMLDKFFDRGLIITEDGSIRTFCTNCGVFDPTTECNGADCSFDWDV